MANPILSEGDPAPDFRAVTDGDTQVSLATLTAAAAAQGDGGVAILYFYPKDDTPGCTTEACDFRDNLARLGGELNAVVFGVSPDSVKSHLRFKDKYELPFTLISDPDHEMAEAYGVWREKTLYGRKSVGIVRSTFVIDAAGKLVHVFDNVRAKGHVDRVIKALS
jgi:peroxiredoxin Q/BCP